MNIAQPDFFGRFFCIGAACEDICCSGMTVVIDKPTFDRYQSCDDPNLKPLLQLKVLPNPKSTNAASFATVAMDGPNCPFLEPNKDCSIQVALGEEYLSRTCDTYPRAYSKVDDTLERSLYLSCPEAARIVLLRSSQIRFNTPGEGREEKYTDFPTVDTSDPVYNGKPYMHFGMVRNFVMRLLRNRSYQVWERLTILGMYCDQMTRLPLEELERAVPALTDSFSENITARNFAQTLEGIQPNHSLLLNVVINTIEDRIRYDYTSQRFLDCYKGFIDGIGYRDGIDTATLAANYANVQAGRYESFMNERAYIWENYLIARAYKDLFPFGPQRSLYPVTRTMYQEYIILSALYIFVRTLVTGFSGQENIELTQDDVVKIVQSFSRAFEHDLAYIGKTLTSLERGKIAEMPNIASLLRP